jgi:uncharacterized Rossmann fold enzyme
MTLDGWPKKYQEILKKFGYDVRKDIKAAKILNSIVDDRLATTNIERKIKGKPVFVIGAGPSLGQAIPHLKKFKEITKIVADSATPILLEHGIKPDIVVTDLDGDLDALKKASNNAIMVVHAHGDNMRCLPFAHFFKRCMGTTQSEPFGNIQNYGGFTDGDRCVFLARHFGANKIILFGMDFGFRVGSSSKTNRRDKSIKIKKLRMAKSLLEWLASKNRSGLYTTSSPILGFRKIRFADLQGLVRT